MTDQPAAGPLLKAALFKTRLDLPQTMRWVAATQGVGLLRQLAQMIDLGPRGSGISAQEYYEFALWRPSLARQDRRAYLSAAGQDRLNARLSPLTAASYHGLLRDKVLSNLLLARAGFPVLPTLAVMLPGGALPGVPCFTTPEALSRWLLDEAPLPVFGKPVGGLIGLGAASIVAAEGDTLVLGDGRRVPALALAQEVAGYWQGWMVQPRLRMHADVAALSGTAAAMLRVLTLRDADGPRTLFTLVRLPARGAMTDTKHPAGPNGNAIVDSATGALGRAQNDWRMNTAPLTEALATGVPLAGRSLPFVAQACRMCEEVHRLFPAHGVLGFDVALTPDGPVLGEVNTRPDFTGWQRAADRGLMNPDFAPRLAAAEAETRRRLAVEGREDRRIRGKGCKAR